MCYKPFHTSLFFPPAIMVHGLAHVRIACAAGLSVTLLSSPAAACAWGCLWWQSMLQEAGYTGLALLDCGDSPGRAVEALELGVRGVVLSLGPTWTQIELLARQKQAVLLQAAPACLDLAQKGNERHLISWLNG